MAYDELNHWYGWNGGECPVEPKTRVVVAFAFDGVSAEMEACEFFWNEVEGGQIVAFCIAEFAPRKPREFWVNVYVHDTALHRSKASADASAGRGRLECIKVREVLDDE
jgi:hypothetical protein